MYQAMDSIYKPIILSPEIKGIELNPTSIANAL